MSHETHPGDECAVGNEVTVGYTPRKTRTRGCSGYDPGSVNAIPSWSMRGSNTTFSRQIYLYLG